MHKIPIIIKRAARQLNYYNLAVLLCIQFINCFLVSQGISNVCIFIQILPRLIMFLRLTNVIYSVKKTFCPFRITLYITFYPLSMHFLYIIFIKKGPILDFCKKMLARSTCGSMISETKAFCIFCKAPFSIIIATRKMNVVLAQHQPG